VPPCSWFQLLESKDGALRSLDSSIFKVRFPPIPLPVVPATLELLVPAWLRPLQLWLKSCHGTGINLPVMLLAVVVLPGVPATLDRLDGAVSRPEVDVSAAAPVPEVELAADDKDNTANSTWPDCGFTVKSLM
jgi:hypothetical protein